MYGLDLFSGYGGISIALSDWVRPVAYCEIEKYCQGILLSRMDDGSIPRAPICDDVKSLSGKDLPIPPDIIYGGFPCQDLSVAGTGRGLGGERSGLFYEIVRLSKEIRPRFIFLENVPGIRTKALHTVVWELAHIGYDCRWCAVSAEAVGAPHQRKRWFLLARPQELAHPNSEGFGKQTDAPEEAASGRWAKTAAAECSQRAPKPDMAHPNSKGLQGQRSTSGVYKGNPGTNWSGTLGGEQRGEAWKTEPPVGRVVDGASFRVDRIKSLGNGVVPLQVKVAFKHLMGLS